MNHQSLIPDIRLFNMKKILFLLIYCVNCSAQELTISTPIFEGEAIGFIISKTKINEDFLASNRSRNPNKCPSTISKVNPGHGNIGSGSDIAQIASYLPGVGFLVAGAVGAVTAGVVNATAGPSTESTRELGKPDCFDDEEAVGNKYSYLVVVQPDFQKEPVKVKVEDVFSEIGVGDRIILTTSKTSYLNFRKPNLREAAKNPPKVDPEQYVLYLINIRDKTVKNGLTINSDGFARGIPPSKEAIAFVAKHYKTEASRN